MIPKDPSKNKIGGSIPPSLRHCQNPIRKVIFFGPKKRQTFSPIEIDHKHEVVPPPLEKKNLKHHILLQEYHIKCHKHL